MHSDPDVSDSLLDPEGGQQFIVMQDANCFAAAWSGPLWLSCNVKDSVLMLLYNSKCINRSAPFDLLRKNTFYETVMEICDIRVTQPKKIL